MTPGLTLSVKGRGEQDKDDCPGEARLGTEAPTGRLSSNHDDDG
jgi:hypothetical protein